MKYKKWTLFSSFMVVLLLVSEIYAVVMIHKLGMVPFKYMVAGIVFLAFFTAITVLFYFLGVRGKGRKKKKKNTLMYVRRVFAVILTICIVCGSLYVAKAVSKVKKTVDKVTQTETVTVAMMGVYVMADNNVSELADTKDYAFAIMSDYDIGNTEYAVNFLNNALGKTITTVSGADITEATRMLYDGTAQALVVNEAYAAVLPDLEEFGDFETKTKLLYEIPIKEEQSIATPTPVVVDEVENVDKEEIAPTPEERETFSVTEDPFIIYLSGSDTRSKILDRSRSDVNILMVVNPSTKQVLLLNTPRDYYVANTAGGGTYDKLTHCGIYGIDCSVSTLENLYGVNVDYYAQINFTGFETLIDELGGVTIESPCGFQSSHGDYYFQKGENQVDGHQALCFARERYAFGSGDNQRGKNQMTIIKAVIKKLTSDGGTLLSNYSGILDSLSGMFVTSMSSDDISSLVKMQLNDNASWEVYNFAVTGKGGMDYTYSIPYAKAYVMYQNSTLVNKASGLMEKMLNGEKISDADLQ